MKLADMIPAKAWQTIRAKIESANRLRAFRAAEARIELIINLRNLFDRAQ